jgi:hypothetical protein
MAEYVARILGCDDSRAAVSAWHWPMGLLSLHNAWLLGEAWKQRRLSTIPFCAVHCQCPVVVWGCALHCGAAVSCPACWGVTLQQILFLVLEPSPMTAVLNSTLRSPKNGRAHMFFFGVGTFECGGAMSSLVHAVSVCAHLGLRRHSYA